MAEGAAPAIAGWFSVDPPALIGQRCRACATTVFPPTATTCPNPACRCDDLDTATLATTGTLWSWATNHYAPPPPYVAPDPFEPFTVLAVTLDAEGVTVLGQLEAGVDPATLRVGQPVDLTVSTLHGDGDEARLIWRFRPAEVAA